MFAPNNKKGLKSREIDPNDWEREENPSGGLTWGSKSMEGIGEMIGTTPRLKGGRGIMLPQTTLGDLCKTPPFARFLRQAQILILEILNVFLPAPWNAKPIPLGWLKYSPSPPGRRPSGPEA